MEAPGVLRTAFSAPEFLGLFCVIPPLFKAEDVPKDCWSLGGRQIVERVTLAPTGWVSACSFAGHTLPSPGGPTARLGPCMLWGPAQSPTQASGHRSHFLAVFLPLISSWQVAACHHGSLMLKNANTQTHTHTTFLVSEPLSVPLPLALTHLYKTLPLPGC